MKKLMFSIAFALSCTQLYGAASTTVASAALKQAKKRVQDYLYEGRREEIGKACNHTRQSTPFFLTSSLDVSFSQLGHELRQADTIDKVLFIEQRGHAINKLFIQLMQTVDNACTIHKATMEATTIDELNAI